MNALRWIRNNLSPLGLWCWLVILLMWAEDEKARIEADKLNQHKPDFTD